jgi:hypothetical protein
MSGSFWPPPPAVPATIYQSGRVYGYAGSTIGSAITAARLYVIPFRFERNVVISSLGAQCTGAIAGNAKFGVYADNGAIHPGVKIVEGNQDVSTAATGYLSSTLPASTRIPAGINWLAICCSAASTWVSARGDNTAAYPQVILIDGSSSGANLMTGWYSRYVALAYTAGPTPFMPASFGASTFNAGDNSPIVSFTVA